MILYLQFQASILVSQSRYQEDICLIFFTNCISQKASDPMTFCPSKQVLTIESLKAGSIGRCNFLGLSQSLDGLTPDQKIQILAVRINSFDFPFKNRNFFPQKTGLEYFSLVNAVSDWRFEVAELSISTVVSIIKSAAQFLSRC